MKEDTTPSDVQPISYAGDFRKLKRNTQATAAEIRAFLAQMRGKSPSEMLGILTASNLFRSTVQATIGLVALIFLLTLLPWLWSLFTPSKSAPAAPPPIAATPLPKSTTPPSGEPAAPAPPETTPPAPAVPESLGIDEVKTAPPDVNPLEKSSDDILKELKP
jgi:hypothetical protein